MLSLFIALAAITLVGQAQQIATAYLMFQADHGGARPPSLHALVSGDYLVAMPTAPGNGAFVINGNHIEVRNAIPDDVCARIKALGGSEGDITRPADVADKPFDCGGVKSGDDATFVYKVM